MGKKKTPFPPPPQKKGRETQEGGGLKGGGGGWAPVSGAWAAATAQQHAAYTAAACLGEATGFWAAAGAFRPRAARPMEHGCPPALVQAAGGGGAVLPWQRTSPPRTVNACRPCHDAPMHDGHSVCQGHGVCRKGVAVHNRQLLSGIPPLQGSVSKGLLTVFSARRHSTGMTWHGFAVRRRATEAGADLGRMPQRGLHRGTGRIVLCSAMAPPSDGRCCTTGGQCPVCAPRMPCFAGHQGLDGGHADDG